MECGRVIENKIGTAVVDIAIQIHKELGPGLLESVYEIVFAHELTKLGFNIKRQVPISITYHGLVFQEGFRADIVIEDKVILELKSVLSLMPVHKKQLLTYLKLSGCKLGYLLNFNEELMKSGISRVVNGL